MVFSAANGNGISVADADAHGLDVQVTIAAGHGVVSLGSVANVSVSGNASASVTRRPIRSSPNRHTVPSR